MMAQVTENMAYQMVDGSAVASEGAEARPLIDRLFEAGLLIRTGVDGLYGRSGTFERILEGIDRLATRLGRDDGAEAN